MAGRVVQGQDGRRWRVKRRWAPRLGAERLWERVTRRMSKGSRTTWSFFRGSAEAGDAGCLGDDLGVLLLALIVAGLVVVVLVFLVVPLLVALVDLVVLLVVVAAGIVGRIAFRRPWTVEARADDGTLHRWKVVGLRASGERRDEVASLLAAGIVPPDSQPDPGPAPGMRRP